jgi:hypothetical protein
MTTVVPLDFSFLMSGCCSEMKHQAENCFLCYTARYDCGLAMRSEVLKGRFKFERDGSGLISGGRTCQTVSPYLCLSLAHIPGPLLVWLI